MKGLKCEENFNEFHYGLIHRQRVEDRKLELERLERRIFPTSRTVIHQDSANSTDLNNIAGEEAANTTEELDKAFATLREATGSVKTN